MQSLLSSYSIKEIIIFLVLLALAIKAVVDWVEWAGNKNKQQHERMTQKEQLSVKIQEHDVRIDKLIENQEKMQKSIEQLIQSDKDQIRNEIVKQYQDFRKKGFIDAYSLDCCEKLYEHYKEEGGNSYVTTTMEKIRELPLITEIDLLEVK